jgi:hypothetical protein
MGLAALGSVDSVARGEELVDAGQGKFTDRRRGSAPC